jgi:WhiB family transcriptional regulator, redox-sensing transcriptional regulator
MTRLRHANDRARGVEVMAWHPEIPGWNIGDRPLEWQDQALCAETDPEAFFPELGQPARAAKRVCAACPVRTECLEYAVGNGVAFGIWGGLTERERRPLGPQHLDLPSVREKRRLAA